MIEYKRLEYEVGASVPLRDALKSKPNRFSGQRERMLVVDYLQNVEVDGMRKHLCFSCRYVTLYDKNNKPYLVSRTDTLERVKGIVEKIKKVNQSE